MKYFNTITLSILFFFQILLSVFLGDHSADINAANGVPGLRLSVQDTVPIINKYGDFTQRQKTNPYDLGNPNNIKREIEYDPVNNIYILTEKIGDMLIGPPTYMTYNEYVSYRKKQLEKDYFDNLAGIKSDRYSGAGLEDPLARYTSDVDLMERLFGGSEVDIRPDGNLDIILGFIYNNTRNPSYPIRAQRNLTLDFDMAINLALTGKIGKKVSIDANYNTESQFNFDNQINIKFDSEQFSEDDIIKNIEAGNVSLPLRSNLIQGAQSLFGLRTDLQFGNLRLTALISQQQSEKKSIQVEGGAQKQYFEIRADEYDQDKHFFFTHYNRSHYEDALKNLPQISSLFKITRMEVWITNIGDETLDLRDIAAVADLGEPEKFTSHIVESRFKKAMPPHNDMFGKPLPSNEANRLYETLVDDPAAKIGATMISQLQSGKYGMEPGRDFELKRARKLRPNEYTYHPELGFISINVPVRADEVLGVSFEYDYNGETYAVGQMSSDNQTDSLNTNVLFVKLLKSSISNVGTPLWDLMMKNVYPVGAYQADPSNFYLDVLYDDPGKGFKRFLPDAAPGTEPLLRLFNLDQLNTHNDPQPDGRFDFVPGITILPQSGKVIFPVLEPFGTSLRERVSAEDYAKYNYQELYDSTLVIAREYQEKNRFLLKGEFQSNISSEISLNAFNIPKGSVTVSAGGRHLMEGVDYEVDYSIGVVRILDQSLLASGVPINVSFEESALISFQQKSMLGLRADYMLNKTMNIGATYMHLWESPTTQKVNIGNDPISNRMFGLDFSYEDEAPWLTKLVDKIPFIDTKEKSSISFYTEGAWLKPGHNRAINLGGDKEGAVYIDDFEGATGEITLMTPLDRWTLASIPQNDSRNNNPDFPEAALNDDLRIGMNRALMNWYRIEQEISGSKEDPYERIVSQEEIFKYKSRLPGQYSYQTFDIAYYPNERGPYNFDLPDGTEYSAGLSNDGGLRDPASRWGGIMRPIMVNDFQASNVEYIEFWVMNPFIPSKFNQNNPPESGQIVLNLGTISEDILKDGKPSFEHGLPGPNERVPLDTTNLGVVSIQVPYVNAFYNDPAVREAQDVGYDGLNDAAELEFFSDYIDQLQNNPRISSDFITKVKADPSNDNYKHFLDESFENLHADSSLLVKYKRYNGAEGNSPVAQANERISRAFTNRPDSEDINGDFTSDRIESYFQYRIKIEREPGTNLLKSNEYVIDTVKAGSHPDEIWYRFKVPIQQYDGKVGNIQDFRSIRFIRFYMKDFERPVVMRFAKFSLVRNQWRRWTRNQLLGEATPSPMPPDDNTDFDINEVSIEENSEKTPFNYVLPKGVERERNYHTPTAETFFNEKSLALNVCNLQSGASRAMYKNMQRDLRLYKSLKMFVHAESVIGQKPLQDKQLKLFVRIGSDYTENYYEYEIPLTLSDESMGISDPENVWHPDNNLDVSLEELINLKIERNNSSFPSKSVYEAADPFYPENIMRIKGNPNLGYIKGFMIGLRNPYEENGEPVCAEVWVNELRVSGLDEQGGAAALAQLNMQLADLGVVSVNGNYSSIGWGGIDDQLSQRSREEIFEYGASTSLNLDKFLPKESGVSVPMYAQYTREVRTPQFDPFDLDIKFKEKLESIENSAEKDSVRRQALNVTTIKAVNFTNVRVDKKSGKPMPWDISNLSASYGYMETDMQDPMVELNNTRNHMGNLTYNYSYTPLYISPFKKLVKSDKYLNFIKEFHFNPLPSTFGVNSTVDRYVNVRRYRFSSPEFSTWYDRRFTWERQYNLRWNFTRTLSLDYRAQNFAVIDELNQDGETIYGERPDIDPNTYMWNNVKSLGRTKDYNHTVTGTWNVPLKNFPLIDFIDLRAQASANYAWNAATANVDSLGNTIQNNQNLTLNANINFRQLYSKWGYLSKIDGGGSGSSPFRRGGINPRGAGDDKKPEREVTTIEKIIIRPLLILRSARANYTISNNSVVPGFMPKTEIVGLGENFQAPGWQYILGFQPTDEWLYWAAREKGWFTASRYLSLDLMRGNQESWSGELNLEPFTDFKVDFTVQKTIQMSSTYLFKNKDVPDLDPYTDFQDANYQLNRRNAFGSFNISYLALNTMFEGTELADMAALFDIVEDNRQIIAARLSPSGLPHEEEGAKWREGYGSKQQDVLIPAFIAAYTKRNPHTVNLDLFDELPRPNWTLNYNGLSKLKGIKNVFRDFSLRHAYQSMMTVNSFESNGRFDEDNPFSDDNKNESFNYYSEYFIPQLTINERFAPLVGLQIRTVNDIQFAVDYNKERNLNLSFSNSILHESRSENISLNFGYLIKNVNISWLSFNFDDIGLDKRQRNIKRAREQNKSRGRDLNIACTFRYQRDITVSHQFDIDQNPRPERGTKTYQLNPTVEYDMNDNMSLQLYYMYNYTFPETGQSVPVTNMRGGLKLRMYLNR